MTAESNSEIDCNVEIYMGVSDISARAPHHVFMELRLNTCNMLPLCDRPYQTGGTEFWQGILCLRGEIFILKRLAE